MIKGVEVVYIGVIPNHKDVDGKPFRTDNNGSYCKYLNMAERICRLKGGQNRYFFIEERYYVENKSGSWKLGNVKKIHHYNQLLGKLLPEGITIIK